MPKFFLTPNIYLTNGKENLLCWPRWNVQEREHPKTERTRREHNLSVNRKLLQLFQLIGAK